MKKSPRLATIFLAVFIFSAPEIIAETVPLLTPQPIPKTSSVKTNPAQVIKPVSYAKPTTQPKPPITQTGTKPATPSTEFSNCTKTYLTSVENLFYLTLAALSANNYKISEIQSKNGYITFFANGKEFLAAVGKSNDQISILKITPANNSYAFPQEHVDRIFENISNNLK